MDNRRGILSCREAKNKDIVEYLSALGYKPSRISGKNYWYLSPLRTERTASFKVDRQLNCWFDHGTGKGGNIIDFGIIYHHCTVKEFLQKLDTNVLFHPPSFTDDKKTETKSLEILSAKPIHSPSLRRYLQHRRITVAVAEYYCCEVTFLLNGKEVSAIGFANDRGGYELRNPWFKGSNSPKAITSFKNGSGRLSVFEGFFNFLSFLSIQNLHVTAMDLLVLNSVAFFEKTLPFMDQYERIHLYLDRDKTGQNFTRRALSIHKKYQDESPLYNGYKDINDWMMCIGMPG